MLKVEIEEKLFIESDGIGFQVKRYNGTFNKEGKENSTIIGHYSNVRGCLIGILKMKTMESTATKLTELVEEIDNQRKYIESRLEI